jgi:GAF domain-containing protein
VFLVRWLVEVASLGKSDKESLFVEAESWQKALQSARGQRGESAPMSGFSIELLDDGCRAVDPMARLRYEVRKAPDDAPATRSTPPRPGSHPPSAAAAAPGGSTASPSSSFKKSASAAPRAQSAGVGPAGVEAAPASAAHAPPPPAPHVAPAHAPQAPSPAPTRGADVAVNVPSQIIYKREQDASDALPMTYREYVFAVPPGTTESVAETLLVTQLEMVRTSLERVASAKLVNLAVFDVTFQGKPPVPPLATLAWKDWRGPPVVAFPRRPRPVAPAPAPVAPAPPPPAPIAAAPPPPVAAPVVPAAPPAAPVFAPPPPAPVVAAPPPAPVAPAPPAPAPPPPAPAIVAAPVINVAPAPIAAPAPVPVAFVPPPEPAPAPRQVASAPPPPMTGGPRTRVRGEDLIADLFEAMHDLHFVRDALEGGEFCLALAMEKLPSQAGIVHLYDMERREFLVSSTRGAATKGLLLRRHPENEPMLLASVRKRRALVVADAAQADGVGAERYTVLGGARSLLVAPVLLHGRLLGAIELVNPLDGQPFNESEGNALTYIAEQFAEFISSHGVVTDPERISQRPPPEA